jgi:hypothetical protein
LWCPFVFSVTSGPAHKTPGRLSATAAAVTDAGAGTVLGHVCKSLVMNFERNMAKNRLLVNRIVGKKMQHVNKWELPWMI